MCLPDFVEFKQIDELSPLVGYRVWRNGIKDSLVLTSESQDYNWKEIEGPHKIREVDSGIYAYNYNYNNNYYNNYNYNYYIFGIINQWGKVAIHKEGQRSEFAKINTLFLIRELDAKGSKKFLGWIKIFNDKVKNIAAKYNAKTIFWQDFIERNNKSV